MKICFVADGQSVHTVKLAGYFVKRGHEVWMVSFRQSDIPGVRWVMLGDGSLPGKWQYFRSILRVRRSVRNIKPDILHGVYLCSYGVLAAFCGWKPLVLSAIGSDVLISPKKSLLIRLLVVFALKRATLIHCVAEILRKELEKYRVRTEPKTVVFPWGVDMTIFKPAAKAAPGGIVVSTRNMEPIYDVATLIRAIPIVAAKKKNVKFVLAGKGSERQKLENLARELKVSDRVQFPGELSRKGVAEQIGQADVYVSTSLSDGASQSLFEAMACRIYPVVADIPGNREWIEDGINGSLFPCSSPDVLAEKIIYALENPVVRNVCAEKNLETVRKKAGLAANMELLEKYYRGLAS